VENFPGFPKGGISGSDLVDRMKEQAVEFGTVVREETVVGLVQNPLDKHCFMIDTGKNAYMAKAVVLATGASAKYLGLESEMRLMNKGVSACATCDGALPRFRDKPLVVIGGGDTAMEEAMFLTRYASKVYIVHRRDKFRASSIMIKRVMENPKIEVIWNAVVTHILGDSEKGVTGVTMLVDDDTGKMIKCNGVFVAIGHRPNSDLVKNLVDLDEAGYVKTVPGTTRTAVEGLFVCGDVQDKVYRQAITAAGTGCMAALEATRWLLEK
jgi:thioredoxin reductase (NADPH)